MDLHNQSSQHRFYQLLASQLAGEITLEEQAELEMIFQELPDLRLQADLFTGMWEQEKNRMSVTHETAEAYMHHLLKFRSEFLPEQSSRGSYTPFSGSTTRERSRLRPLALAALLSLIVISSVFIFSRKENKVEMARISSVTTKYGNKTKISLPDSSQVWLNSGSRLEYNSSTFNRSTREVKLTGEAFFSIAHNAGKPFIVRSGNMQVRVLGTTFNVKAYPEEQNMETSLIKGSVEITIGDRPEDKYRLKPNEKLVVSREGFIQKQPSLQTNNYMPATGEIPNIVTLKKVDYSMAEKLVVETAWVENKLVFRAEKFAELARKLERWYGVEIRFRDNSKKDLYFTGVFTTETVYQALTAMQVVHPFRYSEDESVIIIE